MAVTPHPKSEIIDRVLRMHDEWQALLNEGVAFTPLPRGAAQNAVEIAVCVPARGAPVTVCFLPLAKDPTP